MTRASMAAIVALLSACCAAPLPPPVTVPFPSAAAAPPPAPPVPAVVAEPPPPAPRGAPAPPILCQDAAPTLALSLVLDRSGSMTGTPLEMSKAAARATVEALTAAEAFEVIAFDSDATRYVRMTCGKPGSPALRPIDRISPGGGTEILPALEYAYADLSATHARRKHVLLLTDGRSPPQGLRELVMAFAAEGITISTLALGTDADEPLLRELATKGGGRFHHVSDARELTKVFAGELSAARGGK